MPKGPKLAEEGRVRTEEEYLDWASRVTRDVEDIFETENYDRWQAHYRKTYPGLSPDAIKSERQLRGLWGKGVLRRFDDFPGVGVTTYWHTTKTGGYWQYRDMATGQFMLKSDAMSRLVEKGLLVGGL